MPIDDWLKLIGCLCDFAEACGREAAMEGLAREAPSFDEPMCTLAWEDGYDTTIN